MMLYTNWAIYTKLTSFIFIFDSHLFLNKFFNGCLYSSISIIIRELLKVFLGKDDKSHFYSWDFSWIVPWAFQYHFALELVVDIRKAIDGFVCGSAICALLYKGRFRFPWSKADNRSEQSQNFWLSLLCRHSQTVWFMFLMWNKSHSPKIYQNVQSFLRYVMSCFLKLLYSQTRHLKFRSSSCSNKQDLSEPYYVSSICRWWSLYRNIFSRFFYEKLVANLDKNRGSNRVITQHRSGKANSTVYNRKYRLACKW